MMWTDYQREILESDADEIAFVAARQTGKTTVVEKWAEQNNAAIIVPHPSWKRKNDVDVPVYHANMNTDTLYDKLAQRRAIAVDEADACQFDKRIEIVLTERYPGRLLLTGTPIGYSVGFFFERVKRPHTHVVHASIHDSPFVGNEWLKTTVPESVTKDGMGYFTVDPNEL